MKFFSLEFRIERQDYTGYYKDFKGIQLQLILKKSIFMALFSVAVLFIFLTADTLSYIVPVVSGFLVSVLFPLFYTKKISCSLFEARQSKKISRYDFYADHIEIHTFADETSGSTTQRHLKMNGFTAVTESERSFYFTYMNEKILIIPKRILDEEKYGMIKNLTENYFSNVYMSL